MFASATGWTLIGWNDLGMHCMDGDYTVYAILPPYNNIHAQLINSSGALVRTGAGIKVTYSAIRDRDASINTVSAWKTNFWDFAQKLFGVALAPETGLTGNSMPGAKNQARAMKFDTAYAWFTADGIPLTPYDDAGSKNYYPMMRLTATDASGKVLATTDIVLPVSDEMSCRSCHTSSTTSTLPNKPVAGWVWDTSAERDYKLNILRLHDERQAGSPAFRNALKASGYAAGGLYATSTGGKPILCAACHASNALGTKGQTGVVPLTEAIHGYHAHVLDEATGQPLDSAADRSACYLCHPGSTTRCLRGVMGSAVASDGSMEMQCQNCHGSVSVVGAAGRKGWLEEPNCQACHTGTAMLNSGAIRYTSAFVAPGHFRQPADTRFATTANTPAPGLSLFRFSAGHGGLQCEACHGSTHAETPSSHYNDNVQTIELQGQPGPLALCTLCHPSPNTVAGGPHGMHPAGDVWVTAHRRAAEEGGAQACRDCHGKDYRGTVLSRARADRALNTRFGTKQLWRGYQVSCYLCHDGPDEEESPSRVTVPVVFSRTASTTAGVAIPISLQVRGPATLRIVSQPANGTVSLKGLTSAFTPSPGFEGTDSFTFAGSNSGVDSNLGTVSVKVAALTRPNFAADRVVNAASYQGGAVAPGEMITIFGAGLGPAAGVNLQVNSASLIARELGGTRVLFDGIAAPVIYTSAAQISAMVPYAVAGKSTTSVQVEYQGIRSKAVSIPVVASQPGVFARDASGSGPGVILNADGVTPNSPQQKAPVGSVITVYATGEGVLDTRFVDGQLALGKPGSPVLPVSVTIGGLDAKVQSKGTVPGAVAGFFQVKVTIPAGVRPGDAVPLLLKVGSALSQTGITVAIK